jgi:hypothetical protein
MAKSIVSDGKTYAAVNPRRMVHIEFAWKKCANLVFELWRCDRRIHDVSCSGVPFDHEMRLRR